MSLYIAIEDLQDYSTKDLNILKKYYNIPEHIYGDNLIWLIAYNIHSNKMNMNPDTANNNILKNFENKYAHQILNMLNIPTFENAELINLNFKNTNLEREKFTGSKLLNINLQEASLIHTDFTNAELNNINMKDVLLRFTLFINSKITNIIFSNLYIYNTNFTNANINNCVFKKCKFIDCTFNNTNISSCKFIETSFERESQQYSFDFSSAVIKNSLFEKCKFNECNFIDITFENNTFDNTIFSNIKGVTLNLFKQIPLTGLLRNKDSLLVEFNNNTMYTYLKKMGSGAFGSVWKGLMSKDGESDKIVAIKIYHKGVINDTIKYELDALNKVKGICFKFACCLEDHFIANESIRIVIEFIEGYTLYDMIVKTPLDNRIKLHDLTVDLLDGLQEFRRYGIAHQDIKEDNIMYDVVNNRYRYIDWGLACLEDYCQKRPYIKNSKLISVLTDYNKDYFKPVLDLLIKYDDVISNPNKSISENIRFIVNDLLVILPKLKENYTEESDIKLLEKIDKAAEYMRKDYLDRKGSKYNLQTTNVIFENHHNCSKPCGSYGTLYATPPEIYYLQGYTDKLIGAYNHDLWSTGVVLYDYYSSANIDKTINDYYLSSKQLSIKGLCTLSQEKINILIDNLKVDDNIKEILKLLLTIDFYNRNENWKKINEIL
jgi:uncharacterized protein YjbI with pentapeptide repeats